MSPVTVIFLMAAMWCSGFFIGMAVQRSAKESKQ